MSYSLRNTILLAITLILIVTGSGLWIYFNSYTEMQERSEAVASQSAQLATMQYDADRYETVYEMNKAIKHRLDNYPKSLMPSHRLSYLYNYIRLADAGSTFMNFAFTDSTSFGDYGKISFTIDGATDYRDLRDFIETIERAKPLIKFTEVQLRPSNNNEDLNEVVFRLIAEAYYDRTGRESTMDFADLIKSSDRYNPLFPLVHDIPGNENNRINVESSRMIGMGDTFVFITDQNGQLHRLGLYDKVYLGYMESISTNNQSATFFLNKGGLVERITLRIQQ